MNKLIILLIDFQKLCIKNTHDMAILGNQVTSLPELSEISTRHVYSTMNQYTTHLDDEGLFYGITIMPSNSQNHHWCCTEVV